MIVDALPGGQRSGWAHYLQSGELIAKRPYSLPTPEDASCGGDLDDLVCGEVEVVVDEVEVRGCCGDVNNMENMADDDGTTFRRHT